MLSIDLTIADKRFNEEGIRIRPLCRKAVTLAWKRGGGGKGDDVEVSILLADDREVRRLNREYRNKDCPTNVLSFASSDSEEPEGGVFFAGDIVVSYDAIKREAADMGFKDYLLHLLIHGTLHLMGYDHMDDGEAEKMEALEGRILEELNVRNPYKK